MQPAGEVSRLRNSKAPLAEPPCQPSPRGAEEDKNLDLLANTNFGTYEEARKAAQLSDPNVTKEQIYDMLLKHEKAERWDGSLKRYRAAYVCRHNNCGKEFTKTWNLQDHLRMHQGIKPYACTQCNRRFTQKGNLVRHQAIQHLDKPLKQQKKLKCKVCGRRFTERHNLDVSDTWKFL